MRDAASEACRPQAAALGAETAVALGTHVVQYSPEYSFCAGCNSCEAVCSLVHDGVVSPTRNRLFVERGGTRDMVCHIRTCQQCADHPCYDACPRQGKAMLLDERGVAYIEETECIGCGRCVKACRFDPPRINLSSAAKRKDRRAKKCDLCRTRPEGPACVQYCPVRCLGLSKDPEGRVADPEGVEAVKLSVL